jgi:hypothetical protein
MVIGLSGENVALLGQSGGVCVRRSTHLGGSSREF